VFCQKLLQRSFQLRDTQQLKINQQTGAGSNRPFFSHGQLTFTARMTALFTVGMAIGTGIAAIGLTIFHYRIGQRNHAETRGASALHLSHSRHDEFLLISV
jgi:hypothetical protein